MNAKKKMAKRKGNDGVCFGGGMDTIELVLHGAVLAVFLRLIGRKEGGESLG